MAVILCDLYDYLDTAKVPALLRAEASEAGDAVLLSFDQPVEVPIQVSISGLAISGEIMAVTPAVLRVPVSEMVPQWYIVTVRAGLTSTSGGVTEGDQTTPFLGVPLKAGGRRNFETPHWLGPRVFYPRGAWGTGYAGGTRKTF